MQTEEAKKCLATGALHTFGGTPDKCSLLLVAIGELGRWPVELLGERGECLRSGEPFVNLRAATERVPAQEGQLGKEPSVEVANVVSAWLRVAHSKIVRSF
nr:hypothetical protein GCM10025730_38230 [Promicromonospora thailandica]